MIFQSWDPWSAMSFGTSSLDAASASSPSARLARGLVGDYRVRGDALAGPARPIDGGGLDQHDARRGAALADIIDRVRMPRLPPVDMSPQARFLARLSSGLTYSAVTLLHSRNSSSSATSCARPVRVPAHLRARDADHHGVVRLDRDPDADLGSGIDDRLLRQRLEDRAGRRPVEHEAAAGRRRRADEVASISD